MKDCPSQYLLYWILLCQLLIHQLLLHQLLLYRLLHPADGSQCRAYDSVAPEVGDVTGDGGSIIHLCWGPLDPSHWYTQTVQMDECWDAVGKKTEHLAEL